MTYLVRLSFILISLFSLLWVGCESSTTASKESVVSSDSTLQVQAPALKVGYLNSLELLSLMPEAAEADQAIQSYAAGQERRFQKLAQEYQTKLQEVQQSGATMTPMKQQVAVQEIQKLEQQLQEMQTNSQQRIAQRRDELLAPVMARADSIINSVAKANGFDLVYDAPSLLYADSTYNIMPLVREAMGIEEEEEEDAAEEGEE
ncbi:MAG: OmpH family outer membrane protein [Bacteroidota bacterium]